jgi:hypothetical protein
VRRLATSTTRLGLLKKDPIADGNDTFNIKTMLNENWDKIDLFAQEVEQQLVDISNVDEEVNKLIQQIGDLPTLSTENKLNLVAAVNEVYQKFVAHSADKVNPHGVTKSQVGLGNVDNVKQIPTSQKGVAGGVATLDEHGYITASQVVTIVEAGELEIYKYTETGTGVSTSLNTYIKAYEVTSNVSGTLRIKFGLSEDNVLANGWGRVYINGVARGTERNVPSGTTSGFFTEDIADIKKGDKIQIYIKSSAGNSYKCFFTNISIHKKGEILV